MLLLSSVEGRWSPISFTTQHVVGANLTAGRIFSDLIYLFVKKTLSLSFKKFFRPIFSWIRSSLSVRKWNITPPWLPLFTISSSSFNDTKNKRKQNNYRRTFYFLIWCHQLIKQTRRTEFFFVWTFELYHHSFKVIVVSLPMATESLLVDYSISDLKMWEKAGLQPAYNQPPPL